MVSVRTVRLEARQGRPLGQNLAEEWSGAGGRWTCGKSEEGMGQGEDSGAPDQGPEG